MFPNDWKKYALANLVRGRLCRLCFFAPSERVQARTSEGLLECLGCFLLGGTSSPVPCCGLRMRPTP
eukprot:3288946-Amphidinium_carterae.2